MSEKKVSQYVALALSPSITEESYLLDYFLGHRKNISVLKSSHSYHAEHLPFLSSDHVPQNRAKWLLRLIQENMVLSPVDLG